MKIEIDFSSFRFKIIFTLIFVICTMSFLSFYTYNYFLSKKIYKNAEENIVSVLYFLRDQIIAVHDGRLIKPYLRELEKNDRILHSSLIDDEGRTIYSSKSTTGSIEPVDIRTLQSLQDDITMQSFKSKSGSYSRAIIRFHNLPSCYNCHAPEKKIIGYIFVDFSMKDSEETVLFTRKYSLAFSGVMVLLILGFVLILHYKIIRKSLSRFTKAMNSINEGNLDARIQIPRSTELGKLSRSFNEMVGNFQKTQKELQEYHEKEIKSSQKLVSIGEMSARLAHEIRNPITGIANAIEIIIEETKDQEHKPILEEIQRQANRVNKAISNLLNYSRSKELYKQEGEINEIIKSIVFFLENQASHKRIRFELELSQEIPTFQFDHEQIENVLLNLGINAVQACDESGTIRYETYYSAAQKMVTVAVRDTGAGIPEDKLRDIFVPFYTTRTRGTGLGLAIAKEITEMHHGTIRVENNPESGCTFYISLPV